MMNTQSSSMCKADKLSADHIQKMKQSGYKMPFSFAKP